MELEAETTVKGYFNGLFSALQAFLYTPAPLAWERQHPQWAGLFLYHVCELGFIASSSL